jgi:hypothetical protein
MRGNKMAAFWSGALLVVYGWLTMGAAVLPTVTIVGGGAALIGGCSADRSDARTEARTSERTEQRVEERHD